MEKPPSSFPRGNLPHHHTVPLCQEWELNSPSRSLLGHFPEKSRGGVGGRLSLPAYLFQLIFFCHFFSLIESWLPTLSLWHCLTATYTEPICCFLNPPACSAATASQRCPGPVCSCVICSALWDPAAGAPCLPAAQGRGVLAFYGWMKAEIFKASHECSCASLMQQF